MAQPEQFRFFFPEEFLEEAAVVARRKTAAHQHVQRCRLALLFHRFPNIGKEAAGRRVGPALV
jgi:hypothetical protein